MGKIYYRLAKTDKTGKLSNKLTNIAEKAELAFYAKQIKEKNHEASFCKGKFFLDRAKFNKAE